MAPPLAAFAVRVRVPFSATVVGLAESVRVVAVAEVVALLRVMELLEVA